MNNNQNTQPRQTKQKTDDYIVAATKLRPDIFNALQLIAAQKNMSLYDLAQMVMEILVRYTDDRHNLTPEIERLMFAFEHMEGWTEAFNLADPYVKRDIGEAFYVLQDGEGKKQGLRMVNVTKPTFGERQITYNVQYMLDRFLYITFRPLHHALHQLMEDMDCNSIVELLITLIDIHRDENDAEEIRRMFEDSSRSEYGRNIAYGQRTKRKKRGDIERQGDIGGVIHFAPEDEPEDNSDY